MTKTEAARILADHILTEAVERGVTKITDEFARDVIAEAETLAGTRFDLVAKAAAAHPAFSHVKHQARIRLVRAHRDAEQRPAV